MLNQGYPYPPQPGGSYVTPPAGKAPRRPAVLELAAGAWAAASILFWLLGAMVSGGTAVAGLLIAVAVAGTLVFGCWKVRLGSNGWRVFFTIISGCYATLVPFGFLDPKWGIGDKALSVVLGALCITGMVCSWLPASNRYLRETTDYQRAAKAQRFAEFVRNNPPPEDVQRKMHPNQPPMPPGPPWQSEPPNHP